MKVIFDCKHIYLLIFMLFCGSSCSEDGSTYISPSSVRSSGNFLVIDVTQREFVMGKASIGTRLLGEGPYPVIDKEIKYFIVVDVDNGAVQGPLDISYSYNKDKVVNSGLTLTLVNNRWGGGISNNVISVVDPMFNSKYKLSGEKLSSVEVQFDEGESILTKMGDLLRLSDSGVLVWEDPWSGESRETFLCFTRGVKLSFHNSAGEEEFTMPRPMQRFPAVRQGEDGKERPLQDQLGMCESYISGVVAFKERDELYLTNLSSRDGALFKTFDLKGESPLAIIGSYDDPWILLYEKDGYKKAWNPKHDRTLMIKAESESQLTITTVGGVENLVYVKSESVSNKTGEIAFGIIPVTDPALEIEKKVRFPLK